MMFSTEAVVFVSALLDSPSTPTAPACCTARPSTGWTTVTKVLTEMNEEELLSFHGDNDFIFLC